MYCDEVQLEADTVLATLYVAKKYIVPHLARACVNYLETSLTAKNACLLLSQSRLFEEPELMQRCWEVIDAQVSHNQRVFESIELIDDDDSDAERGVADAECNLECQVAVAYGATRRRDSGDEASVASCPPFALRDIGRRDSTLSRTRSEPHFANGRLNDVEVTQNITYQDSCLEELLNNRHSNNIDNLATCDT